jgi:hypothetical protein
MPGSWMDQTTFAVQPSHHELVLAYSFGGGSPAPAYELHHPQSVAEAVTAADRPYDGPLDELHGIDYRSGLLYLRVPRRAAGSHSYTLFKNPAMCLANPSGASMCRK